MKCVWFALTLNKNKEIQKQVAVFNNNTVITILSPSDKY